ncbi:Crp/Fnr family transcriptional regulator [Kitasatospora sp. NPDC057015]|uniref:Crp/Fnr family transcriptional regulator n=1 Tax=Kitasatospora sp. NPDC057015 TaxID=3346001 RepID=UPI00363121D9
MEFDSSAFPSGSLGAKLAPAALAELLGAGRLRQFADGAALLREGDISTEVVFLLDGHVKVTGTNHEGGSALIAIRSRGDLVGEVSVIDGGPRTATVIAAGAVFGRVVPGSEFRSFLARHPAAAGQVHSSLSEKFRQAIRWRLSFVDGPVLSRLALVLLDLVERWPLRVPEGTAVGIPLNQGELAALVGVEERSVNNALAELRKSGTVLTGYRRIVVVDAEGLRRAARGPGKSL